MKLYIPLLILSVLLAFAVAAGIIAAINRHAVAQCADWHQRTGEQTRVAHYRCYAREGNSFVPLEQRKLDASIQAAQ